jgi:hypothetical protein
MVPSGVQPVLDFDRDADRANLEGGGVEEFNVLADIDERPNLLTMPDDAWERTLADPFAVMGLQTGAATSRPASNARNRPSTAGALARRRPCRSRSALTSGPDFRPRPSCGGRLSCAIEDEALPLDVRHSGVSAR